MRGVALSCLRVAHVRLRSKFVLDLALDQVRVLYQMG